MSGLRVAVEGCGHGTLHAIYASVQKSCREKGWAGIDVLIIGGDFQAVRNARDLNCMAVPLKYRAMGDFHEYYSGQRVAPYLTIFVGGNHEASNHLFELFYGGWVAPNIYYMGAANVLKLGPLRIAGLSGIWKGHDYNKPHFERLPYNKSNIRSIYHTREIDTRKLLNIRSQVDVGISHDWPRGVEWLGDSQELFGKKKHLKPDADVGQLGNVAARKALDHLRPSHWFAAHLHVKYAAICHHDDSKSMTPAQAPNAEVSGTSTIDAQAVENKDEIDLDLDDESNEVNGQAGGTAKSNVEEHAGSNGATSGANSVSDDIRSQLPASFSKPVESEPLPEPPTEIHNTITNFLALDKCLPGHEFLQLLEIKPLAPRTAELQDSSNEPLRLEYDPEWLAITRVFAPAIRLGTGSFNTPRDQGRGRYAQQIDQERSWIEENVVKQGKLTVPNNFEITAPVYDASETVGPDEMPREFSNPQTQTFCELVGITNPCALTEKEIASRIAAGPPPEENNNEFFGGRGGGNNRGHRGSRGGFRGGRGRGRGRG